MARKQRPSHLDDHPAVSSSTEEEEEEEQTLSDDDDDEEEQEEGEEEEEEEEGEQSSSEEQDEAAKIESLPSAPPVKPHSSSSGLVTIPMEPESTRSTRSSTRKKKRPNSETETTPSKRVKKKDPKSQGGGGGGGEEKKLFQRLWSDDNEIELLKGMLDYRAIHDSDPAADAAAFYEFVKKSLHVEVTKAQLVDKMKRLRKKYRNNARRGKKGKDPTFSKPHERKIYQLSKKIWSCTATDDGVSGRCLNGMLFFNKNVVLEESLIKKGLELIGQQKIGSVV